jgi:hypothetical protein
MNATAWTVVKVLWAIAALIWLLGVPIAPVTFEHLVVFALAIFILR